MIYLILFIFFTIVMISLSYISEIVFPLIWNGYAPKTKKDFNIAKKIKKLKERSKDIILFIDFIKILFISLYIITFLLVFDKTKFFQNILSWQSLLYFLLGIIVIITFGKIIPKFVAYIFYEKLAALIYYYFRIFETLFMPFLFLFKCIKKILTLMTGFEEKYAFLTKEERVKLLGKENGEEELNKNEQDMIHSIFHLQTTEVKEIMLPRTDTIAVDKDENLHNIIDVIKKHGHSRIPVYEKNIDNVIGILNAKDLLKLVNVQKNSLDFIKEFNIKDILRNPYFVPVNKKINELFQELKKQRVHIAIVVDEYGGTAGIVTLEDILEEIVGEIQDEYDKEEELIKKIDKNSYEVDPKLNIDDLNRLINVNIDTDGVDYDTLGGLIFTKSGAIPSENFELLSDGLKFTVLKMDGQRIEKLRITKLKEDHSAIINTNQ